MDHPCFGKLREVPFHTPLVLTHPHGPFCCVFRLLSLHFPLLFLLWFSLAGLLAATQRVEWTLRVLDTEISLDERMTAWESHDKSKQSAEVREEECVVQRQT